MEICQIGEILKEHRTRLKISQEELCFDLCAVSTLSRIESGLQIPGRKLIEALFSKMGESFPASGFPMTKIDFKRANLEHKINDSIATGNFNIKSYLDEYKSYSKKMNCFEIQFYLFYKTLSETEELQSNPEKTLVNYITALKFTLKNYDVNQLPKVKFLTKTETLILNNIARTLYLLKKQDTAINIMEFLRSYFEKGIVSEAEKSLNYHVILFNLENWYGQNNEDKKVLPICETAINICIQYGKLTLFPYHIFNKGCALIKLGNKKQGIKCLKQSITILESMKSFNEAKYGKKWVAEHLNISI